MPCQLGAHTSAADDCRACLNEQDDMHNRSSSKQQTANLETKEVLEQDTMEVLVRIPLVLCCAVGIPLVLCIVQVCD